MDVPLEALSTSATTTPITETCNTCGTLGMKLPRTPSRKDFFLETEREAPKVTRALIASIAQASGTRRMVVEKCHYRGLVRRNGRRCEYH